MTLAFVFEQLLDGCNNMGVKKVYFGFVNIAVCFCCILVVLICQHGGLQKIFQRYASGVAWSVINGQWTEAVPGILF